jgi:hypothetical protein
MFCLFCCAYIRATLAFATGLYSPVSDQRNSHYKQIISIKDLGSKTHPAKPATARKPQTLSAKAYFPDILKNPGFKLLLCKHMTTQNESLNSPLCFKQNLARCVQVSSTNCYTKRSDMEQSKAVTGLIIRARAILKPLYVYR